ncbi:UDP-glucose 4-epimerase GalE [Polynucleobacter sp. AM-26B4]|uniref:UDP-glucose 4-epimerase GalE n=1 Tax=Polynucleobacter sp. AM-26B4 TaxID=2689103 RepID=UPI001C0BAF61|nr:UDP-glucose 4-epimerase GalE [Polynucleobacter sp. AM-26B4]MBU3585115.1 UDP-glucose 4-epimerase GalE [Polynucleobacter sp. AM-26B4]
MILITGATGYIGSHTWVELLNAGYDVVGIDNLCNSNIKVLDRIEAITSVKPKFIEMNVCNSNALKSLFNLYSIDAVIHFAALKAVGKSVNNPLEYYKNNLGGILELTQVMSEKNCFTLVFSSSATVYDANNPIPYQEGMPLGSTSPYGWTKLMSEQMLRDLEISNPNFSVAYLRYFNPIGAHESGFIGEDPLGIPNNLMPYITQVAIGKRPHLSIYGNDWLTHDGTGVRDYIHVVDLARGHLKALNYLMSGKGSILVNLGTGKGFSVLDLVKAFEKASNRKIPYQFAPRRIGDIAAFYSDSARAQKDLNWRAEYDLYRMCEDSWRWQSMNPNGYE